MNTRQTIAAGVAAFALIVVAAIGFGLVGSNDDQNWQIKQSLSGNIDVIDSPGYYFKGFSTITTYPRARQLEWGPVRVTFNDGGTAMVNGTMRVRTPNTVDNRRIMHREFGGDSTMSNAQRAIESHLINAIKVTGPVMSGSEHQSARKSEFYNLVSSQLRDGLYSTRKIQRQLLDQTDSDGRPITVFATEVILGENGQPVIDQVSPLQQYGFDIAQFSIESTDYDEVTLNLFAAKKESLLNAERSKAAREEEVQERLMITERGLKQKAEIEAQANMEKARLTIEAETKVAVAGERAREAEELLKQQTTEAQARRDVAALDLEAEKLNAESVRVIAAAEEERITRAGAITERDRVLAEIEAQARVGVAEQLSKAASPSFVMSGGGESGGGTFENMLNVFLMRQLGVFDPADLVTNNNQ